MENCRPPTSESQKPTPRASAVSRVQFFLCRQFVPVSMVVALLVEAGGATLVAVELGLFAKDHGALVSVMFGLLIASCVACVTPLLWRLNRPARRSEIAAALASATVIERPHLLAKFEDRIGTRIWSEPISILQLVLIFDEVRAKQGRHALDREDAVKLTLSEQKQAIATNASLADMGAPGG